MNAVIERVSSWTDDRLGISKLRELASHKTVPMHRYSVFYYLGGMTLFFFFIQVFTGVMLMLYYRPGADEAFESVEFIMTTVPFGWLIRSIHSWSANLMVFFTVAHLISVFFMKAYRPPRELTWITGVLLLFLILGFGFSGYLLPWNQLAFFATKVGTDIAGAVPLLGEWMVRFLRGGDRVSGATLSRFYGWHVAVLPALTFGVLLAHLVLVQVKGMSVPRVCEEEAKRRVPMKFFPHFALRDLSGWIFALGVLAALGALLPWELGEKADLFAPAYEDIRPEWYFVFMFQTLKLVPGGEIFGVEYEAIPLLLFGLGGAVLLFVPFLDRRGAREGKSPLWTIAGVLAIVFAVVMTCWGYNSLVPLYAVLASVVLLLLFAFITRGPRGSEPPPAIVFLLALLATSAGAAPQTSCTACHGSDLFDARAQATVHAYSGDVHAAVGLSCHDCHGGNPDVGLSDDMAAAMDPGFKANPYAGTPERGAIPEFCGRCHSSAEFMRRFNPAARVDQVTEYWSSHHGRGLRSGDTNVATCIDCHSVHDIKRRTQPDSPVHPTHVAETCSRCHSNAKLMSAYRDDAGRPLPTDQYARWRVSVHARALLEKSDMAAPTCNDCHGNHGATPPGVESVSFVCGQCHGREAELFRASNKHDQWTAHNELMAGSECSECHDGKRAAIRMAHFSECVSCHENHGVLRPTVAMLSALPETPCAFCHEGVGPLSHRVAEPEAKATNYANQRKALMAVAARMGVEGDRRFDWLVDQAQELPQHLMRVREGEPNRLRPEFARLFEKFRIGKTHYTFRDELAGTEFEVAVRRCNDCHETDDIGHTNAAAYLDATRSLTTMIARSERILLAAQRGGVEVRQARSELDAAVDSQIELETLVHTFAAPPVQAKQKEGLQHAEAALLAGQSSLEELLFRRKGLFFALGVIVLALIALALKIRTL
ncbi:MAG TPA: cytochrome b N-terminal domain-containing protein [Thermoanaerobaculia bacterium]|nr:cytochrome b N-terminal domain-containing protein [Thermoanaerobaculia bacterium]